MLTGAYLRYWWRRALRKGILHKVLDGGERAYLYVAMKAVEVVRSLTVARILMGIIRKLRDALLTPFMRAVLGPGLQRAGSIAQRAVEWGYEGALSWAWDLGFARYLAVMEMNTPRIFRSE